MNEPRQPHVAIKALNKRFGQEQVLKDVSLSLEAGRIHGIIGRNGSGKTVMLKCVCGFLRPDGGSVTVSGKVIGKDCDFAPDTGMLIETPGFLPHETGMDNLLWLARLTKKADKEKIRELIRLVGLDPADKKGVGKYSMGMRQRLGIAQALLEDADLLILDEPMNGLDNQGVKDMRRLFIRLREQGKTIILASHFAQDIEELCDTVHEMDQGVLTKVR